MPMPMPTHMSSRHQHPVGGSLDRGPGAGGVRPGAGLPGGGGRSLSPHAFSGQQGRGGGAGEWGAAEARASTPREQRW